MKALLWKTGLAACLTLGLWHGQASVEAATGNACSQFGAVKAKQNPSYQHINCLLTEAAISADIPPEVVKAVATQENGSWEQFTAKGTPVVSADGGIGLMQLTNKTGYDQNLLKTTSPTISRRASRC